MGHIPLETAVCDIAGDSAGDVGRTSGHRRNRVRGQCGAVARRHTAEHPADKADSAARAHAAATVHNGIAHKTVGLIPTHKAGQDTARCGNTARSASSRTCTGLRRAAEHRGCASAAALGKSGQRPGGHQHLHTHAAPGLRHGQSQGRQVTVAFLGDF